MNRAWFILLAFSVGLNGALLYDKFLRKPAEPEGRSVHFDRGGSGMRERHSDSLPHMREGRRMERRLGRMVEELHLTNDQRDAIRRIHEASIEEIMSMRRETRALRDSFHVVMAAADFDPQRFREMGRVLHDKQRALESAIMENLVREAEVLTPEQRADYQSMMMGPWRHGGRGGRAGRAGRGRSGP